MRPLGRVELVCDGEGVPAVRILTDSGRACAPSDLNHLGALSERCPTITVRLGVDPLGNILVHHPDLSVGSAEREFTRRVAEAGGARFIWVKEGVETVVEFQGGHAEHWRKALELTEGVAVEAWREELSEQRWRSSSSHFHDPARAMLRPEPARTRPAGPIPFYAETAGAVPRAGRPTVAGIELPAGVAVLTSGLSRTGVATSRSAILSGGPLRSPPRSPRPVSGRCYGTGRRTRTTT
jgi:hypothetical protein